jgi:hypothetical protein
MRAGQTFRISSKEYAQPVLRTFMLLSVAGKCPTTKNTKGSPVRVALFGFRGCKV